MSIAPHARPSRAHMFALALLVAATWAPAPAQAWSELGHRIVGELAHAALSPAARAEVDALLAGETEPTLAGVSAWPDRIRDQEQWRHTAPWHYINFPHDAGCHYHPERDCRDGDCVVGAIERELAVLADHGQPRERRAEALKFVVHFIGDVHQPLHAGHGHDKGGNDYQVNLRLPGRAPEGTNLHRIWDWWILASHEEDASAYARELAAAGIVFSDRDAVRAHGPARWAEESCRIMREPGFYPRGHRMRAGYLEQWRPTAEKRLREAAGRLARVLEKALVR